MVDQSNSPHAPHQLMFFIYLRRPTCQWRKKYCKNQNYAYVGNQTTDSLLQRTLVSQMKMKYFHWTCLDSSFWSLYTRYGDYTVAGSAYSSVFVWLTSQTVRMRLISSCSLSIYAGLPVNGERNTVKTKIMRMWGIKPRTRCCNAPSSAKWKWNTLR